MAARSKHPLALTMDDTILRPMTGADIPQAHAITAALRWPYRQADWALLLAHGEGIVAERQGQVVGTAMSWRYGTDWATIGAITVAAALQGRGLGRRLTEGVIDGLAGRTIALYATVAGEKLYVRIGFRPVGTIIQHQGAVLAGDGVSPPHGLSIRPACDADLSAVAALDHAATGMHRHSLLATLLATPGGLVLEDGTAPAGFALVRRFGYGEVIGPVAAPSAAAAQALIAPLLDRRVGQFVRMDFPPDDDLAAWLTTRGLLEVDRPLRMVRGATSPITGQTTSFAIVSQSLG